MIGPMFETRRVEFPLSGTYVEICQSRSDHYFGWRIEHGTLAYGHSGTWGRDNYTEAMERFTAECDRQAAAALGQSVTVSLSDAEPFRAQVIGVDRAPYGTHYQVESRLGRKNWVSECRITLAPKEVTIMLHMTIPADAQPYEIARDIAREVPRITYGDCTVDDYEIPSDR